MTQPNSTEYPNGLRVIGLQAQNFKRLVAIEINPPPGVVQITGANGAGKSSAIDALMAAIAGERNIPSQPIRHGANRAEVVVDLGELVVRRTFTPSGTRLTVTTAEGSALSSPQAILDRLYGERLEEALVAVDNYGGGA